MQKEQSKASFCIDIGTTSLKAALISECGFVFSSTVVRFSQQSIENPFEITNCWINALFQAGKNLQIENYKIVAFCISGNGPTLTCVNEKKTFTLLWNNNSVYVRNPIQTKSIFLPRILLLKDNFSEIWQNSKAILSGPEFLIYFLTDKKLTILPENQFLQAYWTKDDLSKFEISSSLLPDFVQLGEKAGFVKSEILATLGINSTEKIPVFCGGPDFVTALIGTNTLSVGKICDRSGSSEGINLCSDKPIQKDEFRNLPSVIPGLFNVSYLLSDTGTRFTQWKNSSEWKNESYENCINYLLKNQQTEGYKMILEIATQVKIAFSKILKEQKKLLTENTKRIPKIICTGGQAKNPSWMQFKSNVTNVELWVTNCPDAELMGNAIISSVGLGNYSSIKEASDTMIICEKKYYPKINFCDII
jgi:sugar (pentulose or hexulose) kinase